MPAGGFGGYGSQDKDLVLAWGERWSCLQDFLQPHSLFFTCQAAQLLCCSVAAPVFCLASSRWPPATVRPVALKMAYLEQPYPLVKTTSPSLLHFRLEEWVNVRLEDTPSDVLSHLVVQAVRPYLTPLWTLLFTRLSKSRTVKFVKALVVFLSLFIVKYSATEVSLMKVVRIRCFQGIARGACLDARGGAQVDVKYAPRLHGCLGGGHSVASEMPLLVLTRFGVPVLIKPRCQGWT